MEYTDSQYSALTPMKGIRLHCCILTIATDVGSSHSKNVSLQWKTYECMQWLSLPDLCDAVIMLDSQQSDGFLESGKKLWKGTSPPEMVAISSDFKTLDMISNHQFRFISPGRALLVETCRV